MKCIKKDKTIRRVSDSEASKAVTKGWSYCPKIEWKKFTRKSYEPQKQEYCPSKLSVKKRRGLTL